MDQILKKALKERELSQKEFAELIHVTPQAVSKWLNGESRPSQDNVILIFETLGRWFSRTPVAGKRVWK